MCFQKRKSILTSMVALLLAVQLCILLLAEYAFNCRASSDHCTHKKEEYVKPILFTDFTYFCYITILLTTAAILSVLKHFFLNIFFIRLLKMTIFVLFQLKNETFICSLHRGSQLCLFAAWGLLEVS